MIVDCRLPIADWQFLIFDYRFHVSLFDFGLWIFALRFSLSVFRYQIFDFGF